MDKDRAKEVASGGTKRITHIYLPLMFVCAVLMPLTHSMLPMEIFLLICCGEGIFDGRKMLESRRNLLVKGEIDTANKIGAMGGLIILMMVGLIIFTVGMIITAPVRLW
jgi:hypothetical protein